MRTFNFVFMILAVLSCTSIAMMIGAMPTGNGTPALAAQALHLPQLYVHWHLAAARGGSDSIEISFLQPAAL